MPWQLSRGSSAPGLRFVTRAIEMRPVCLVADFHECERSGSARWLAVAVAVIPALMCEAFQRRKCLPGLASTRVDRAANDAAVSTGRRSAAVEDPGALAGFRGHRNDGAASCAQHFAPVALHLEVPAERFRPAPACEPDLVRKECVCSSGDRVSWHLRDQR